MRTPTIFDAAASRRLDAVYRTPDIVGQRREVVRVLDPQPGEAVLDVGSGPGILLGELADRVHPGGRATGVDLSESMLALAGERLREGRPMAVLKADAVSLPFGEGTFDAAVSTQVYEYVADIATALADLNRVLRPGGRAVILDTDWDSIVWNAGDRRLMQRVLDAWSGRFAHADLPRTLSRLLRDAGFTVLGVRALVLLNPGYDRDTYSVTNLDVIADYVTATSDLTAGDLAAWRRDLEALGQEGRYFFSLNRYLFLATKKSQGD